MKSRTESLQLAKHRLFDLLVIGGGLAGAGVAQDAASRGLSVMLVEKDDFASGSSSRTMKLIRGGLRSLEQMDLPRARQLCAERSRLERLAPHMVRDCGFILPLSKKKPVTAWKSFLRLALYEILAFSCRVNHHFQGLGAQAVLQSAPALSGHGLVGGLRFYDSISITDDARLALAVLKSACQQGAVAVNYLEAKSFAMNGTQITGVTCRNRYSGEEFVIRAKAVVNATGAWTDEVCRLADPSWTSKISCSKNVYFMVPASAWETNTALMLPAGQNGHVHVIPWQHALLIGSTNEPYKGDINQMLPTGEEIDSLLQVVNGYSDTHHLSRSDITASFAASSPVTCSSDESRGNTATSFPDHFIFESPGGLFNVAGGDLTSYRLTAGEVVSRVLTKVPELSGGRSRTEDLMLGGWADKQDFLTQSMEIGALGRNLSLDPATIDHLISAYGSDAAVIMGLIERDGSLAERVCPNYTSLLAEVIFSVQHEMAACLEDVLFRRMRLGALNQKQTLDAAPKVARIMQQLLDWDQRRYDAEMANVETRLIEHMQPVVEPVINK
jgi:glycerol-3-phosphate dehydrogenase